MKDKKNEHEMFMLGKEYSPLLKEAVRKAEATSGFKNESIKFEDSGNMVKVKVFPTIVTFLFNAFKNYGQLVAQHYLDQGKDIFGEESSLHIKKLSVYVETSPNRYYLALHANGAIIQNFNNIEQAAEFLFKFSQLFELSDAAYRCDPTALEDLQNLGIGVH